MLANDKGKTTPPPGALAFVRWNMELMRKASASHTSSNISSKILPQISLNPSCY